MMRVVKLTEAIARRLLAARRRQDHAAERVAARIVTDVRRRGDVALRAWTRRLDGVALQPDSIWVQPQELRAARRAVSREFLRALEHAARNIRRVAEQQKPRPWTLTVEPGVRVGQLVRSLDSVGCYVPGGRYSLVSTLLMTVIPAQVAGVKRILVTCPRPNAVLLAAADRLGVREVARVGGAQAIAALAYGTQAIPPVDKIVGPGNRYVTAAKRQVSADCAIDFLAGPTELLILARSGNPRFLAADLVAQAEHDPDAIAVLVTPLRRLANAVERELARQLQALPRTNPARRSLSRNSHILVARNLEDAVRFVNWFAPEHLTLPGAEPALLKQLHASGSVFLGPWSAQPLGDYASGSNHVLPTGGWARARGGLSVG
ncbi:MAG: histidinol dehydrogenase, partial [Candidatus Acidoferrales bacterium]